MIVLPPVAGFECERRESVGIKDFGHSGERGIVTFERGTIVAMATEALRTVKDRFSEYIDRVEHHHERIVVTRNGHAAAVIISTEDLESLEETLALLTDPHAMEGLRAGDTAVAQGEVVRGVDSVRALRPKLAK